jgi:trimeric autotransporter adhesin
VSDSCYIGNVWQQPDGSQAVYVNASGKLGAQVSSRRFKDEINPMEETSEVIYRLKPVSFRYKPEIEPTRPPGFGLIAEDVEKINPDLVLPDKEGRPYTVRYDAVNAMSLNEFLKEHRKVQELEAAVASLMATVKEQARQIQKVSAQLELNKPAPQTVLNDH